jgi:AAA domain
MARRTIADELRRQHRNGQAKRQASSPPPESYPEDLRSDAWEGNDGDYQSDDNGTGDLGVLLSTVQPQRVEWLWRGRIPLGKLTILDGDPGLGKSVLTLDLAARVSRGLAMPDGTPGRQGGVVLLTAEDGLDDTVVPRLEAAGADRSRILALDLVPDESGLGKRLPSLPRDAGYILAAARRMAARLVVADPLTAYLGDQINSHRDQDCRRALWPLAKIAEETGAAVLVVRHLNKDTGGSPLYRGGGSIGIIGAARSGLLVAADPDNPDWRVLATTKCNLARKPVGLKFALEGTPDGALRVGWMGESVHTAESLLAAPRDEEDRDLLEEAVGVLRAILAEGSILAVEAKRQCRNAGVSERTMLRAKAVLGVRSNLIGFGKNGHWHWSLPTLESATDCQTPRSGHLWPRRHP